MEKTEIRGVAAGVPYVALPPAEDVKDPGLVIGWHLTDPPRSDVAMAAAVPMTGVPAWRVYFALPMHGDRQLPGGVEEFMRLAFDDAVMNINDPLATESVEEFPAALAAVRDQLGLAERPIGLFGGSFGAGVAALVLLETDVEVSAVALVSPMVQLAGVVALNERRFDVTYPWHDAARAVADRMDFVARAEEFGKKNAAIRLVVGEKDDPGILEPAERLWTRLSREILPADRVSLVTIPGMAHALADEPGIEAAPQNSDAARADAAMAEWFKRWL